MKSIKWLRMFHAQRRTAAAVEPSPSVLSVPLSESLSDLLVDNNRTDRDEDEAGISAESSVDMYDGDDDGISDDGDDGDGDDDYGEEGLPELVSDYESDDDDALPHLPGGKRKRSSSDAPAHLPVSSSDAPAHLPVASLNVSVAHSALDKTSVIEEHAVAVQHLRDSGYLTLPAFLHGSQYLRL